MNKQTEAAASGAPRALWKGRKKKLDVTNAYIRIIVAKRPKYVGIVANECAKEVKKRIDSGGVGIFARDLCFFFFFVEGVTFVKICVA